MSKEYEKHIELLGLHARDKVTGMRGVITSVSFDVSGCVQAILTPPAKEDGSWVDGRWFDVPRLEILPYPRVIDVPNFDEGYIAEGKKGPSHKPLK